MTKRFSGTVTIGNEDMDRLMAEVVSEDESIGRVKAVGEVLTALTVAMHACGARHATYKLFEGSRAIAFSHMTRDEKTAAKHYLKELAEHMEIEWDISKGKLKKKVKEELRRHTSEIAKVNPLKASPIAGSVYEKHFRLLGEEESPEAERKPA